MTQHPQVSLQKTEILINIMSKIVRKVRLRIDAGAAKPGPAIGQALGPLGLNMADFCKQFNDHTKNHQPGVPLPVELTAYTNRTFSFKTKSPPTSWFLKRCAGVSAGAQRPGHQIIGTVHAKQIYEIALMKQKDEGLQHLSVESIARSIAGSCQSMGLSIENGE